MATLIKSKQIQGVVTASVIEGVFTVSGSLITTDITASGNVTANTFTGNGGGLTNINFGSIVNAPTLVSGSSQIVGILSDLNTFSGSQNTKDSTLATYTASVTSQLSNLTQATSSYETKGRGIISSSAQISALGYVVGGGGGGTSDYTQLINVPNGIVSGSSQITALGFVSSSASVPTGTISSSAQITSLGFVSSSTNISALNTFTSSIDTKFATLGSQTGSFGGGASIPPGTISGSAQITGLGFVSSSVSVPSGTISGSSQLTGSFDLRYTLSGSVQPLPSNVVSGSSQISYTGLSNIPVGIISSSQQLPQGLVSGSSQILGGSGVISGSSQLTSSYDSRYTLSGSVQNVILPSDLISSSAQISALGFVSGSYATSQSVAELAISSSLMTASIAGLRADVTSLTTSGVPSGTISGSLQIQRAGFLLSSSFNSFTQSLAAAITASGTNVTINGNLTVKGTTTTINSTTIQLGDNIIELNGSNGINGGLLVKDSNGALTVSGSLLWDATNDRWIAGPKNSEEYILLAGSDGVVSGSSQISFTDLSNLPSGIVSSSDQITSSLDTKYVLSGSITQTTWDNIGSKPGGIVSGSSQITALGFISSSQTLDTGSLATTGSNTFIGTQIISGSLNVSGTINPDNVTVGIPTSNAWQSSLNGSYFNNFTSETNVSEILRFVAGLLSASAPDASPNTRTLSSVTATAQNTTTGTALTGRIPQTSTNTTITYLNSKGFATAGSTMFSGITINTANYGYNYTSVAGGTTTATSSLDSQLFGLGNLSSGAATNFKVSGSFTFRFKDNSAKTDTATSSSVVTITQTGAGTTSGVTLALIPTANSAVIPAGYQDGKFASALGQTLYSGSATAVSASGYYHISASIQIASGSSGYSTPIAANGSEVFWAPLTTISTNVPTQTPTLVVSTYVPLTATSRSLSGAPYLTGATYEISASVSGTFNPLFYNGTIAAITEADSLVTSTGTSTVATSGGTISTANAVYGLDNTLRSTSTIPYETDTIRLNSKFTFTPSTNENINQTGLGTTSFIATISGYNFAGTQTSTTATILYHSGSTFGQPLSSGSMAYYGASQASDASATTLYEPFLGENYRIQLADNVLAFNGTAWTTSFGLYNLGVKDLQVKPGHLVKPGGTYAYWLGNPSTASDYKYYIRKFTTSGVKTSMTLNLGQPLVEWDATTNNSAAAVILFESSKNTIYTPARVYDPTKTLSNFVSTISANTDGQNPFGSSIDLYGNTGGSVSSTTYTIPLRNGDGMFLNATYTNIYVIVRYKGDPTPIASITVV